MRPGRPRSSQRLFREDCLTLDIGQIDSNTLERASSSLSLEAVWEDGRRTYHRVWLAYTKPHFGGVLWCFVCPRCRRRVEKLYAHGGGPQLCLPDVPAAGLQETVSEAAVFVGSDAWPDNAGYGRSPDTRML